MATQTTTEPMAGTATIIRKASHPRVAPNLGDYERECARFDWARAREQLSGLPGGKGLNIAYEAVDRHVAHGRGGHVALRCIGRDDRVRKRMIS
ncbi:hypothetical protein NGB36_30560 [Streptomyces sp. RB6PN25]|uniref:Uncharacterized protein n=1 Tax=Streptomyces humicola TaxID=2953240 RepID=A0ABT1Q4H8_9ACTN|nr:hypothetical protein [Streptomyces humicola]MCQ4084797.1 hypothetical protein [Streptomyces humicola]